jgi:hypothetical protein
MHPGSSCPVSMPASSSNAVPEKIKFTGDTPAGRDPSIGGNKIPASERMAPLKGEAKAQAPTLAQYRAMEAAGRNREFLPVITTQAPLPALVKARQQPTNAAAVTKAAPPLMPETMARIAAENRQRLTPGVAGGDTPSAASVASEAVVFQGNVVVD